MPEPAHRMTISEAQAALNEPPQPSIGRIVHYVDKGLRIQDDTAEAETPVCRAAIVTETYDGGEGIHFVGVAVLNPTGITFHRDVSPGHPTRLGTWHWPERADG